MSGNEQATPGRPTMPNRRGHPRRGMSAKRAARCAKALELRVAGGSYRQIAEQLGVDLKTAYEDVQVELGKLDQAKEATAERLRDIELSRCDKLTIALAGRVATGDPKAVTAMIRVMERRARLLGLDKPAQIEVTASKRPLASMTDEELRQELAEAAALLGEV